MSDQDQKYRDAKALAITARRESLLLANKIHAMAGEAAMRGQTACSAAYLAFAGDLMNSSQRHLEALGEALEHDDCKPEAMIIPIRTSDPRPDALDQSAAMA